MKKNVITLVAPGKMEKFCYALGCYIVVGVGLNFSKTFCKAFVKAYKQKTKSQQ